MCRRYPRELIPPQIAADVKEKYPGRAVTEIGLERNGISVRLADGTELLFDSDEHNLRRHLMRDRRPRTESGDERAFPATARCGPPAEDDSLPSHTGFTPRPAEGRGLFLSGAERKMRI